MNGQRPSISDQDYCSQTASGQNAHPGDYRVLKRCIVKRWEDISKLETCLQSLGAKRRALQGKLVETEGDLVAIDRCLPLLSKAIDELNNEIEKANAYSRLIEKEREGDVDNILEVMRGKSNPLQVQIPGPSSPCACRRFNASLACDFPRQNIRSLASPLGNLKCHQEEIKRKIDMMRAEVQCKITEKNNLEVKRDNLKNVIEQLTRNLSNVTDECQKVNTKWSTFRSEIEKMESQMREQWGRSVIESLTPANVSRCRFF